MFLRLNKTKLRIMYWGTFILFMVLVVFPLFFFFYLFDEDKVKQAIIDQFDNKNYNVEIYGGIVPKIWHGMSLDLSGVLITTKNADELIKVRQMSCKLSWWALIVGRYSVNRVAIDGVDINKDNLIHYGLSNLLNISNRQNSFFNIDQLEVYNIDFVGKNIVYQINSGSFTVERNGLSAKFSLGFKSVSNDTFYLINGNASSLGNNAINFDTFNMHVYNTLTNINVASQASYLIKDKQLVLTDVIGNLEVNGYSGILNVSKIALGLNKAFATGATLQIDHTNNFINHHLLLNADNISTRDYHGLQLNKVTGQYKSDIGNIVFNVDSKIQNLIYTESQGLYSNLCSNQLNFSYPNIKGGELNAILNGKCMYNLDAHAFRFALAGSLNSAPVKLDLQIINNKAKPYIIADGNISSLNLSKIRFDAQKTKPLFSDTNQLPFAWLSLFNAKANLTIGHFALDRIVLDNLVTRFNIADNQLNVQQLKANVYNGQIDGNLKVIKNGNNYDIYANEAIQNLSLKNMLSNYFDISAISGTANMTLDANAHNVRNYDDVHRKISGYVSVEAKNGAFQGVDFNLFVNPESSTLATNRSTIFHHMTATFNFIDGISNNGTLEFSSPYVIANGRGVLSFVNDTLNYSLNIKSALPKNEQKISSVVIPVSVDGAILSPKISIQNVQLIEDKKIKHKAEQRIRSTPKVRK